MRQIDVEIEIESNPTKSFPFLISGNIQSIKFSYADVNSDDVAISIEAQTDADNPSFETIWMNTDPFPIMLPVGLQWWFAVSGVSSGSIIAKLEIEE